jgi:hypothetical protein
MKKKKKKPTLRSTDRKLDELGAVVVRQENWIKYLRNNLDLVSEMLYGHMELNGDVEKVVEHVEKKRKEKEDAISDGKKTEELSRQGDSRDSEVHGESV